MWAEARMEGLQHQINEYIHGNLDTIIADNLDRVKEIIAEIENEKQTNQEG